MIDLDNNRLNVAKTFGATQVINSKNDDAVKKVMSLTDGKGVDVAIEAVRVPETFELCQDVVNTGGHIANVGVHGKSAILHLETLWSKNVTITTGLVDTYSTPMLFKNIQSGKLEPKKLITHHFKLELIIQAYDTFQHASKEKALKVILTN
jgi:alcohol dehydrogenase